MINDLELNYNPFISVCANCVHFNGINEEGNPNCKAFEIIPVDILRGEAKHDEPTEKQTNDVVFEAKK